jgi:hypothetical protein
MFPEMLINYFDAIYYGYQNSQYIFPVFLIIPIYYLDAICNGCHFVIGCIDVDQQLLSYTSP